MDQSNVIRSFERGSSSSGPRDSHVIFLARYPRVDSPVVGNIA